MKEKNEKVCGCCCWFYAEDTYGFGACPHCFSEVRQCSQTCVNDNFVSRDEMRRHVQVLLDVKTWFEGHPMTVVEPHAIHDAVSFAAKYINIMANL